MLKIKLMRTGRKNQPSYRIVVQEARSKLNGNVVDSLGNYCPLGEALDLTIDKKKYQEWVKKGAQPTLTVKRLYKKA